MNRRVHLLLLGTLYLITLLISTFSFTPFPKQVDEERDVGVVKSAVEQTTSGGYVGGYASKVSVAQGESINFHVSTNINGAYALTVWHESVTRELKHTISGLTGAYHSCAGGYMGCGWPVTASMTIPTDWPSGAYTVDIPTQGKTQKILFWVRENNPGSTARILFLAAINTYNAYTEYGGKSVYNFNSTDQEAATKVSFNRPLRNGGVGDYFRWDGKFPAWAIAHGYEVEFAGDYDLEFIPDLLTHYDVVVIGGHSEYWTWNMRQRVKAFINSGGRFVNLSGNTMWWQIRYEDNGRTMVAYKSYEADPLTDQTLVTENTWDYPVLDTEYAITGAHFPSGGFAPAGNLSFENGYGGFWVQQAGHWVFENTNLQNNDIFGRTDAEETAVIEHEVDGTTFNCAADGKTILGPLGNTGSPHNYTILAISPAYFKSIGFATMGIYTVEGGGAVFSANTIGWATALEDPQVSQITQNILDRFLSPAPLPQEPVASADTDVLFYDRFNCSRLYDNGLQPVASEWDTIHSHNYFLTKNTYNAGYTDRCGVEGSGLEITMNQDNNMLFQSQVKPNWGATDRLYTRVYMNLMGLKMANEDQFDLYKHFYDTRQKSQTLLGQIQIRRINGVPHIRYKPSGGDPPWHPVPDNHAFLFETLWDKDANLVSIWIDEQRFDYAINLNEKLPINRVDMLLKTVSSSTSGRVCVDEFAFDTDPIARLNPDRFEVQLSNSLSQTTLPGETVTFSHQITNTGTVPDSYHLEITTNSGWEIIDAPASIDALMPGETRQFTLTIQAPPNALADTIARFSVVATSAVEKSKATAIDRITVDTILGATLSDEQIITSGAGQVATLIHTITNTGNAPDSFYIEAATAPAEWALSCTPSVVGPLAPGEAVSIEIAVQVPDSLTDLEGVDVIITALSQSNPAINVTVSDQIIVEQIANLQLSARQIVTSRAGQIVTFTHTVTNRGNAPDSFDITATTGSPEWVITANPITVGPLAPGEQVSFEIIVQVPTNLTDFKDKIVAVLATSQADPLANATVFDEIEVEIYRIYLPLVQK